MLLPAGRRAILSVPPTPVALRALASFPTAPAPAPASASAPAPVPAMEADKRRTEEEAKDAAERKEAVVRRYFDGVNLRDRDLMASCFADPVELRDMCGPSGGRPRLATPSAMADRCMEFLAAHPDCVVRYGQPPACDRNGEWVWCHWEETGTWTGRSRGIEPGGTPLEVGGHTRFLVELGEGEGEEAKIRKQVVYRTFAEWELSLQRAGA